MSLLVKVHKRDDRTIVAVCDKILLGKLVQENNKQLDLRGDFYKGEEKSEEEVGDLLRNADGVNLVGEEAVKLGLQEGVITEENVLKVEGVPHAQAVIIQS